jgi:hypothetical protein
MLTVVPKDKNKQIPIEPAIGSNIIDLDLGLTGPTFQIALLIPIAMSLTGFLFVVREGFSGELSPDKMIKLVVIIFILVAVLAAMSSMIV